jgi:chemotaxis protein CheX
MSESANYNELAQRYGLEPIPSSVARLTKLVSRQDADLEEITAIIKQDKALALRLLRAANPGSKSDTELEINSVEDALMRTGISCVLVIAMGAPLTFALIKTFHTMLGIKLESVHPGSINRFSGEHMLGTIRFSGKAEGKVFLSLSNQDARKIAAKEVGLSPEELTSGDIDDAIGELLNIIAGNLKSNLCDAGLDCALQTPQITHTESFLPQCVPGGSVERMAFQGQQLTLFVDVSVNPFADS